MPRVSVVRSGFFWKLYLTFAGLILISSAFTAWFVSNKVGTTIYANLDQALINQLQFLDIISYEVLEKPDLAGQFFRKLKSSASFPQIRINVIDKTGKVLSDTVADPETLENHLGRPEIQAALLHEYGKGQRFSHSLNENMIYFAKAIKNDQGEMLGFARISLSLAKAEKEVKSLQGSLMIISGVGILLALLMGIVLTKRITGPVTEMVHVAEALRQGNYDKKVKKISHDEFGKLGETLNRLGSELTSKIDDLHRLEKVRRDFVANVSHEIKTPLTSIKGYIETLLSGADEDKSIRRRFLEKIDRNANRLANIVQDILSLAKIEAGEAAFKPVPVDLLPILSGVIGRYEDSASAKGIKISFRAQAHMLMVLGDKESLIQVIDNLLSNGIKYTPETGKVAINVKQVDDKVILEVTDTGIGIPEEDLERIFERFYRVDKARSRDLGGTGLGLSIVKHLISAMHGEINVESKPGSGSKFTVKLQAV